MGLQFDHAFICCAHGAPEADALLRLGLREGSGNTHPGQGTANRRFFFANAYLELLWISDEGEATSPLTLPTQLRERCSLRSSRASPFGILFRPGAEPNPVPFPTWSYRPHYLPPGASIETAVGTPIEEPGLLYLPFVQRGPTSQPTDHAPAIREISGVTVELPGAHTLSAASHAAQSSGLISYRAAPQHLLELQFPGTPGLVLDLRPTLPLIFRGV